MMKYFGLISSLAISALAEDVPKYYEDLSGFEKDQLQALRKYWPHHNAKLDLHPEEKDTTKKLIYMHHETYDTKVISNATSQFVGERPWFISFVRPSNPESVMMSESL